MAPQGEAVAKVSSVVAGFNTLYSPPSLYYFTFPILSWPTLHFPSKALQLLISGTEVSFLYWPLSGAALSS